MRRVPTIAITAGLSFWAGAAAAAPSSMIQTLNQACDDTPAAASPGPFGWATKWFQSSDSAPAPTAPPVAYVPSRPPAPVQGDWRSAPLAAPTRPTNPMVGAATMAPLPAAPSLAPSSIGFTVDEEMIAQTLPPVAPADPTDPRGLRELGHARDREGDLLEAERLYRKAIGADPTSPAAVNDLGLCLARQGKLEPAAAILRQAITMRPDKPLYRNNIATVLVELGRPDEALDHLKAAYRPAAAHHNLGQLLVRAGAEQQAIDQFRQAVEHDPSLSESREALAKLTGKGAVAGGQPATKQAAPAARPGYAAAPTYQPTQVAAATPRPEPTPATTYEPTPADEPVDAYLPPEQPQRGVGPADVAPQGASPGVPSFPRLLPPVLDR